MIPVLLFLSTTIAGFNPLVVILTVLIGGGGVGGLAALFLIRSGNRSNNANASGQISEAWGALFEPYRKQIADLQAGMAALAAQVEELTAANAAAARSLAEQALSLNHQAEVISSQAHHIEQQAESLNVQGVDILQRAAGLAKQDVRIRVLERALIRAGAAIPDTYTTVRPDGTSAPQRNGNPDPYSTESVNALSLYPSDPDSPLEGVEASDIPSPVAPLVPPRPPPPRPVPVPPVPPVPVDLRRTRRRRPDVRP